MQVKIATNHLSCGQEVTIDIGPDASCSEIKQKLVPVTGVPVEHQKVLISGANQIILADKRQVAGAWQAMSLGRVLSCYGRSHCVAGRQFTENQADSEQRTVFAGPTSA